jgi:FkbM family methyltransferase
MKPKSFFSVIGLRLPPKRYGFKIVSSILPDDGEVRIALWQHPKSVRTALGQNTINRRREFIKPGDFALDIGAQVGRTALSTAIACGPEGLVIAFEPNAYVFPVLKANSELNPTKANLVALPYAATENDGSYVFNYSDRGFGNGGAFPDISRWRHGHAYRQTVEGRNVEALLTRDYAERLPHLRYVKIDVEGYDLEVIRSLDSTLAKYRPFLSTEVHRHLSPARRRETFRFLRDLGYEVRRVENSTFFGPKLEEADMNRSGRFDIFCAPV